MERNVELKKEKNCEFSAVWGRGGGEGGGMQGLRFAEKCCMSHFSEHYTSHTTPVSAAKVIGPSVSKA